MIIRSWGRRMDSDISGSLDFVCQYKELLFKMYLFRGGTLLLMSMMPQVFQIFLVCLSKLIVD